MTVFGLLFHSQRLFSLFLFFILFLIFSRVGLSLTSPTTRVHTSLKNSLRHSSSLVVPNASTLLNYFRNQYLVCLSPTRPRTRTLIDSGPAHSPALP
ncbi:hypothetical protein BY996DRAFT_7206860 [Phakopsora pachyrhizi]|nr:hypothetical protein BY996DRAFT_7206860 [Phakopsora pachyrhizi]